MLEPVPRGLWFGLLLAALMATAIFLSNDMSGGLTKQEDSPDPGRIVVAPLTAAITLDFVQPKLPWSPEKKMSQRFDFDKKTWSEADKKICQTPIDRVKAISIALTYSDANPMNDDRLACRVIIFAKPGDSNIRDCLIAEPLGLQNYEYIALTTPADISISGNRNA